MTTIITRLYQDEQTANEVAQTLLDHHFRAAMMDVIGPNGDPHAEMDTARVPVSTREAYAERIAQGNALLVVRAPFGGAERAFLIVDQTASIDMGDMAQSSYVAEDMAAEYQTSSIIAGSPRLMSSAMYPSIKRGRSTIAMMFGKPLMRRRDKPGLVRKHGHFSKKFWPQSLLDTKPRKLRVSSDSRPFFERITGIRSLSSSPDPTLY